MFDEYKKNIFKKNQQIRYTLYLMIKIIKQEYNMDGKRFS